MLHVHRPWAAGDVIGVCMDLEKGELSFVKNGVNLGGAHLLYRSTGSRSRHGHMLCLTASTYTLLYSLHIHGGCSLLAANA